MPLHAVTLIKTKVVYQFLLVKILNGPIDFGIDDVFSSLREDRRPLDQGVRKMEGAGWREPMDWSTVSIRSVFGSFLIEILS